MQKSKDFIEKKYSNEYKEYIKFLLDKKGKEYALQIQLLNEEHKKLYEIHKLEKKIEECKKIKKDWTEGKAKKIYFITFKVAISVKHKLICSETCNSYKIKN